MSQEKIDDSPIRNYDTEDSPIRNYGKNPTIKSALKTSLKKKLTNITQDLPSVGRSLDTPISAQI
jgi:hypothetical protein